MELPGRQTSMNEPIAIIGTACRLPGSASSPSKLWELIKAPQEIPRPVTEDRLNLSNFYSPDGESHGSTDVRKQPYLLNEDIRRFDASFFRINPKEAAGMDPQHRILLETVYEAFEAAGLPLGSVEGSQTSVHVGVMTDDYAMIQARDIDSMGSHAATGLSRCILSNRVSYAFDLRGPSMTVDTACSSSLVALHLAVQSLRKGEASQAVVGGTSLLLDPHWFVAESSLHMLSSDSRSRMWDVEANGYARGEGCAVVILKPLNKAIQDGDHIESVIRETGVNSDGRTNGMTMPCPIAQATLIQKTYQNAGLDPVTDRCQYFECHGTGTQAGDPVEARAISSAFFPSTTLDQKDTAKADPIPLYCGSIKTIVGHLEGCAGLAGLLRASLAVQHGVIPPNMHFNELNPSVKPFYTNLCVPTSPLTWPDTHGQPRRASVNSFGFGGTNAHTIIESYVTPAETLPSSKQTAAVKSVARQEIDGFGLIGPFVFSARSRTSLSQSLRQTLDHLRINPALDLDALSSVLHSNRSALTYRIVVPAMASRQKLLESLEEHAKLASSVQTSESFGVRALNESGATKHPGILGIFTGQGAQAAQMGRQLVKYCTIFRQSIQKCEADLKSLPEGPTWSLMEELIAEEKVSRLSEAVISQPLCTALQIALVDLLKTVGIEFAAVVGHSSGEIGAAYAAGLLSGRHAMGIAYYRGQVAHLAKGLGGKAGGMMAAALTFQDAKSLCSEPRFKGRVSVAAGNAPSSVTLSGDLDAIEEIKGVLTAKKIQARQLRVDTAYHSHHMLECTEAYLSLLQQLKVQIRKPAEDNACVWFSSVRNSTDMVTHHVHQKGLEDQYWVDNMVQPVLFSEAVQFAIQSLPARFAIALEVGPHPALKGPVSQTIKSLSIPPVPYVGCLEREKGGIESMSSALGTIWSYLGPSAIDFGAWRESFNLPRQRIPLKGLPTYAWDHDQVYWLESRLSHNMRVGGQLPHTLLGRQREDTPYEKTWRNFFHLKEMLWVTGHTFQGQVLFPGAGYFSIALEASKAFVQGRPIKLLEVRDMNIPKALVIGEDEGVEVVFTMRSKTLHTTVSDGSSLEAEFVAYSCSDGRVLDKTCDARLFVHLGGTESGDLLANPISRTELTPMDTDRFYRAVSEIDLGYAGAFRTLHSISRSWGHAKASASWSSDDIAIGCSLHPATLDVAFQVGLGTVLSTAEKSMGSPLLPVGIRRAFINPNQNYEDEPGSTNIEIEAMMVTANAAIVEVDISLCAKKTNETQSCGIQIDGLILKAIAEPQPSEDRNLFVKTIWDADSAYGLAVTSPTPADEADPPSVIDACERITLFYMQNLIRKLSAKDLESATWYHQELFRYIHTTVSTIRDKKHAILREEWLDDDRETILKLIDEHPESVDIEMLVAVGENLPSVVRKESGMMEHMLNNDLLSRLYKDSRGLAACNQQVANLMRRISHKHPRMRILEIGAGTGGTTLGILSAIGEAYTSYTCTDISASFFNGLSEKLPEAHTSKVNFKVFDAERPPGAQGFAEGSYDIVIAANVLHATRKLSETVRNARALLRPGGHLIAIEVTGGMIRETGLMGGLEGWWLGTGEGRKMGPGIDPREWDSILEENGFSGVDCITHDHPDTARHSCSVFATQAVDERVEVLREPLSSMSLIPKCPVLILGGKSLAVSKLARRTAKILSLWSPEVRTCSTIDGLDLSSMLPGTFILCLSDLDNPFFAEPPTPERLDRLQGMLGVAHNMLWVTCGRMVDDPYANMMVGIGRALAVELPHVNMHYLDFDCPEAWNSDVLVRHVLRMAFTLASSTATQEMLWSEEPEVLVKGSEILVPRIVPDHAANETLNAKRRKMSKTVTTERITIDSSNIASQQPQLVTGDSLSVPENHTAVDVKLSLALHTGAEKPCFLCFGRVQSSGQLAYVGEVLVLSAIDSSTVVAPTESLLECCDVQAINAESLVGTAFALIALQVVRSVPQHGTTLVFGATVDMAHAISAVAAGTGHNILFVAVDSVDERKRENWIVLHPRASARVAQRQIPKDTSLVINMSKDNLETNVPFLPLSCVIQTFDPSGLLHEPSKEVAAALGKAHDTYRSLAREEASQPSAKMVVNIAEAPRQLLADRDRLSLILDWERHGPVSAVVRPLEASSLFSTDKTYFLVGMAGELGQSLCRFMIRGGARHIVLASRNPAQDPHWLKELRSSGTNVRIVKMDVTDRAQVHKTVSMLRRTMPTIGGVANAALVFEAGIFVNFSADNVTRQLKPKVDGSLHLDEAFASDNLEFFLTFGSLATVCGNPGQAMYHAGNMFMSSLVEKRRRRGQAASILNFGLLVDVGYVARMDRADGTNIEGTLRSLLLTPLSEAELHHLVLQGIISGRPGSASGEVIMGMPPYIDDGTAVARPPWVEKAFFSHMIHAPISTSAASHGSPQASTSNTLHHLRSSLNRAGNITEITQGVRELMFKKIELMIKVPRDSIDASSPLADLGLDSLHGIDIRKWLLEDLKVNIPLLKILGREPLSSLCDHIAQSFMETQGDSVNQVEAPKEIKEGSSIPDLNIPEPQGKSDVDVGASRASALEFSPEESRDSDWEVPSASPGTPMSSADETLSIDSGAFGEVREVDPDIPPSSPSSPLVGTNNSEWPNPERMAFKRSERLSFAQAGIHFLHTFLKDSSSFNVTTRYSVRGRLNTARLADAIEKTLGHHEAYQTCFFASSGSAQVKQNVTSDAKLRRLRHIASTTEQAAGHAQEAFKDVANTEYQLASGETFRAVLVTHGPEKHTLIFGFHLMASDALSFSIFLRDLDRAYQMRPLAASTGSYLDFSCRQHEDIEAHRLDASIRYWRQHLDPIPDTLPLLPIAQASSRKASRAHQNHIVERKVEVAMVKKVKTASQACGATSMQFYLAVMQVLIARLGNVDDLCIGIADSGRSHTTDFSDSIGHFANILPVRFKIDSVQSFKELVNQTSHSVLQAFDNSQVPFDLLLEKLGIERSPAYTPLFQVAFNYRVGDILQRSIGDCALSMEQYVDIKTPYDLVINVTQAGSQGHLVECITNGRLYSIAATEFITETFVGLVESLAKDQFIKVRDCKLFNNEQVEGAVTLGRGPTIKHTWPKTLSERFQDVVSLFPNSIAIKDDNESLTYNLLTSRVGLYASSLVNAGAGPGSRVAVLCVPSIDIYATMLAALHIGAVYVPLDVNLPIARLRSMMDACKPDVLVFHAETDEAAKECSRGGRTRTLDLSELQEHTPRSDNPPPLASTSATQESFLLFTSGSTGTPKGIRLGQRGIMNYAASKSAVLGLGQVRVLQQTSCGFDMAIAQAFNAFANGGTLVIAPTEARGDPTMISKIMLDEAIEFTLATPSEYLMLTAYAADTLQRCTSWRFACSGGEVVSVRLVNSVRRLELPELNFMDCYGPTEVSCAVTFRTIQLGTGGADSTDERNGLEDSPASKIVGKAISNTSIYILSEDGKTALPFGMPGEICIGGSGVARGYLDSRLSQDKFVPNPFATPDDRAQGQDVMYHTGDKGYLLADGSLAFLGRINGGNTLIKLRGLRIDLDEVAGAILAAAPKDCIADAIVMARGEPQFLVAYVVYAQGRSIDHEQLELLLRDLALPRYMVPSMIVPLDHLPTSTNGKIDRATLSTLPLPDQKTWKNDKTALTVPEGELRALWQTVLGEAAGAAAIGPHSDFFTVGGSSLLLVRLQNILRERMGVLLPLQDLYQATTLRKMAAAMHQERGQLTEETIDWKLETAIPDSVLENAKGQPSSPPPKSHDRQVLLTGAGSFLGSEILTQLLKNDDVAKIHCVAVSDDEREKLSSQDDGSGRMIIYAGSLMSPTLGLSGTERALLRTAIDQIIHAAVQGHCMNNYTSVKDALYISTQTLVRLALPRQVPFHFISAPRVVLLSGQHEAKPVSMAAHLPPTDGSQGVTASKWASECFLEKIAQERDLPVVVHRHCALIGERAPADDVMNSVVRFSVLTRKVPNVPGAQGFFDFKDVVAVASEIEGEAPAATGAVCYRHHSGDVRVPFSELAKRLSEVYGGEFETVEPSEWLQAAGEFGMGEMLVIHLKANMESGKPMVFPYLGV